MLETETIEPETLEDRERLEWQTMLASVLAGDVLKAENTRIAVALKSSSEEENNLRSNLWLGIRARVHARTEQDERKILDERRLRVVDAVIKEIMAFRVEDLLTNPTDSPSDHALRQVKAVLHRLDVAHSLYPSLRAFYVDYPAAAEVEFQSRCDTLNTWSTVITSLRQLLALLRRWTGSETLDVTQPSSNPPTPFSGNVTRENASGATFVERFLKEEAIQRQFEKGSMTTIHALVGTTRDAHVNLAPMFREMNLPSFEKELVPLVSFLTNLAQAVLRVRLDYAQNLKNPDVLIIDQMTDDLKLKIGLACTLKRQYEAFLIPDPGGNWKLPPCISADYDSVILEALTFFFKLIHWKLKSGAKGMYFKETDVIEAQWATFSDVSLMIPGGASLVAEQLCALTNKLMVRVTNYFDTQIRIPVTTENSPASVPRNGTAGPVVASSTFQSHMKAAPTKSLTNAQLITWYGKILDGVKQRYRKLQRLARVLTQRFCNAAEYDLQDISIDLFIATLVETDHFLVYTQTYEEDGTYIVASPNLRDHPDSIRRILLDAFHISEVEEGSWMMDGGDPVQDDDEEPSYLLVLSPRKRFLWNGLVLMLGLPKIDLELKDNRCRLIADGAVHRLALAKQAFMEVFMPPEDEEFVQDAEEPPLAPPPCLFEQQAHLPTVNKELRKISRATNKLAESIVESVHYVRKSLHEAQGYQELLENWYGFASEHGQHVQKFMDGATLLKFNRSLIKLAISWVSFICDDCDPNDRKTFRWAVTALEFTLHRTRRNNILHLPDDQFEMLRQKVASCMTLLISHFDILGARSNLEAKREKERQEEILRQQSLHRHVEEPDDLYLKQSDEGDLTIAYTDPAIRMFWDKASRAVRELEDRRSQVGVEQHTIGRVLDEEKLVDRSLVFLASSSSNVSIRWQQGRFIGAGSFGSVYLAVNLDSGSLMAVKEIRFQEVAGLRNLYHQIKDELNVMEMLHHPNVVEYYGIEVHREKVYIFEEYCQGGSLAALLEHGRIEDEGIIQVYTLQMLEGLAYLHSKGVIHRDIKPDNILLDHMGVIKFVDFGAAKILAKNQRSIQRSRRADIPAPNGAPGGLGMNSLTGTPMYMSPEVIRNSKGGRQGAMDIWSLGCVVLECATGRKPWSNLDNEWAIMFHIGVATQHPPLPEPGQLSDMGIDFIRQCLTIDPLKRPMANELMNHPWILDFREALESYEQAELATSPPMEMPSEETYKSASVARQAAIIQEKQVETIQSESPSMSPLETPILGGDEGPNEMDSPPSDVQL
ncbi:hypothetical protein CERSUDRAFT_110222 [Gelatoporia subvermispora B]|uniref:Protein kinase domain-containing protein n=1 Tax=Ceriporiopsis subvermispora (strain B) TaxID=914234 RepID=M2RRW4_CERS8|nr:hypothetical protein CERSUDRAFT_110222 [Gelatoporia subvermispora B]